MTLETARIEGIGRQIPFEKVQKTFFKFVEILNEQKFEDIKGQPPHQTPSKMIVGVRFSKNFVGAKILLDGEIREKTYEAMSKFQGRQSWGLRCFGDFKVLDGYLCLEISGMDYDPSIKETKK